jgi:spore maturation protein CgeB
MSPARTPLDIVIVGLSITSSWGNGHATTYRGLVRARHARGHRVLFLERDAEWYASNRDLPNPPFCRTAIYHDVAELRTRYADAVRDADLVVVGSYVPDGAAVGEWVTRTAHGVTAFYDIDTPVTLAKLEHDAAGYLTRALVPRYDLYLSFTGGPTLERIERELGSPMARPLYCSVDPALYYPEAVETRWDLGYLGTYSPDRQPALDRLLLEPARRWRAGRFAVMGAMYPDGVVWPPNVRHGCHLSPGEHRAFYCAQRYTLNVTRADMVAAGWSPSVRLFEAAACGTPIVSDQWEGLDEVLAPGRELLVAHSSDDVLGILRELSDGERRSIGMRARARVLASHTAAHRALELEAYAAEVLDREPTR